MKSGSGTKKICANCSAFRRIYRNSLYGFFLYDQIFYCTKCRNCVPKNGLCGEWKKRKFRSDLSARRFDRAEKDVLILLDYFNGEE